MTDEVKAAAFTAAFIDVLFGVEFETPDQLNGAQNAPRFRAERRRTAQKATWSQPAQTATGRTLTAREPNN